MADLPEFVVDGEWEDPERDNISRPFKRRHPYSFNCHVIVVGDRQLYFPDVATADAWVERVTRSAPQTRLAEDGTRRMAYYGAGRQPWDSMIERGWAAAFAAGSIVKYLRRDKGERAADVEKARWYDQRLLELRRGGSDPLTVSRATGALWGLSCELTLEEAKLLTDGSTT